MTNAQGGHEDSESSARRPKRDAASLTRFRAYVSASWPWILLTTAIVLVAAILRVWDLGKQGLWFDEIWTVNSTMHGAIAAIKAASRDTNPPLSYVLGALAMPILGRSDAAVRVVPAISGVVSTVFMYLAGRKLFDRPTGAWAAALFAVSAIAVQYAQEVRMYSALMLFSALLLWAFALLLEKPTMGRTVVTGVALAALMYTHVFGYMVGPILLGSVMLVPGLRKRVGRQTLIACAIAAVLFLPWVSVLPAQIAYVRTRVANDGWWMQPPSSVVKSLIVNLLTFSPGQQLIPSAVFVGLLIGGVVALPRAARAQQEQSAEEIVSEADRSYLLLALAVLPILFGLLIAKYVTPVYSIRNTLVSLPPAYILAAHGGVRLRRPVGYLAMLLLLVFGLSSHPQKYPHNFKGYWWRAATLVAAHPEAAVLAEKYSAAYNLEYYPKLRDRAGSQNVLWVSDLQAKPAAEGARTTGDVTEIPAFIARFDKVYVVTEAKDSAVAVYMDGLPGWKLATTEKLYKPVIRLYTKVKPSATP